MSTAKWQNIAGSKNFFNLWHIPWKILWSLQKTSTTQVKVSQFINCVFYFDKIVFNRFWISWITTKARHWVIRIKLSSRKDYTPKQKHGANACIFWIARRRSHALFTALNWSCQMKKKSLALFTLNLNQESDSKTTENPMASISTRCVRGPPKFLAEYEKSGA